MTAPERPKRITFPLPPMTFGRVPDERPPLLKYRRSQKRGDVQKPNRYVLHGKKDGVGYNPASSHNNNDDAMKQSFQVPLVKERLVDDAILHSEALYALDPRFQYTAVSAKDDFGQDVSATHEMQLIADSLLDDLLDDSLQEEIIPDLLIEALRDVYLKVPVTEASQSLEKQESIPSGMPVVEQAAFTRHLMLDVLGEVVVEECITITKEASEERVREQLQSQIVYTAYNGLLNEIIKETCCSEFDSLREECLLDIILECDILDPAIHQMVSTMVSDEKQRCDELQSAAVYKKVAQIAPTKVLDQLLLSFMLAQQVRQEEDRTESAVESLLMDSICLDILLRKHMELTESIDLTSTAKQIRKYHERVVGDVVIDILLNELCLSLDQDVLDFEETELLKNGLA